MLHIIKKVLLNTGLFGDVEGDLRGLFDLKVHGLDALCLASYGCYSSFHLFDEEQVLTPPKEGI